MLRYKCLVLDHDDTVVQSESTINYPYFCYILDKFRPGARISLEEYMHGCFSLGFNQMCRDQYHFTEQELKEEFEGWMGYVRTHVPDPFPGIEKIICQQKERSGLICVVSHSSQENITRDYQKHFGILPDEIYGWDYPESQRKPNPYPLQMIMQKYNLQPEDILVVDDMKPAYEMCKAVNVPIAFAGWGRKGYPEIVKEMTEICNYAFMDIDSLENFLFQ